MPRRDQTVDRRRFLRLAGAKTAGVGAWSHSEPTRTRAFASALAPDKAKRARMKVGCQRGPTSDEMLQYFAQLGVTNICGHLPLADGKKPWTVAEVEKLKKRVESHGISLDMLALPLSSSPIGRAEFPNILLARQPERDREIDAICSMIRVAAKAGIHALKYNLTLLGVVRTEPTLGRGGCKCSTFVYAKARQEPPLTEAGKVSAELMWERISYFLERVIPVATEHKVRMACHPHDPPMPPDKGFRGVHRVLGSVEGLKKFITIQASPYHGLNFCQGSICEGLKDPGKEIFDVIRYFGTRKKIFNVHFRNISGRFLDFHETFPDEGVVNMFEAMKVYQEVGYEGMIMPDHMPQMVGDTAGRQAFAYGYGYIRALIQAVESRD